MKVHFIGDKSYTDLEAYFLVSLSKQNLNKMRLIYSKKKNLMKALNKAEKMLAQLFQEIQGDLYKEERF